MTVTSSTSLIVDPTVAVRHTPASRRRLRRVVAALLATASLATVGATVVAQPASAATRVSFCFTFQNPPAFTAYANRPVYLYKQTVSGWSLIASGTSGSNGCGTFYNTPPAENLWVRAYLSTSTQTWDGWTPYYAPSGAAWVNVGSGNVYRTR